MLNFVQPLPKKESLKHYTEELYTAFTEFEKENDDLRKHIAELEEDNGGVLFTTANVLKKLTILVFIIKIIHNNNNNNNYYYIVIMCS